MNHSFVIFTGCGKKVSLNFFAIFPAISRNFEVKIYHLLPFIIKLDSKTGKN